MNQIAAMKETLDFARIAGMDVLSSDIPEVDFPHLHDMYERVIHAEEPMSEAKIGRWLGWIQACVVAAGIGLSLEDMKEINMRWADK